MYTDFFYLNEEPFQVTPNPKYLFLSNVHREALQKLADGIRRRKGFIEMVGVAGTGKTLLCKELVQMLSSEMDVAYLFYPVLNEQALYHAILKQWGANVSEEVSVSLLLDRIYTFLKERFKRGRNALIILDEAQNLSISLLENLRLLSNLETESEKLLQILLTGQPEFHQLLKSGKIPQLDQRIRVRIFLEPLDRETLPLYIYHRLNTAGGVGSLEFTKEALSLIYNLTNGIPRMINAVCERALEEAFQKKTYRINASIVRKAQGELEGRNVSSRPKDSNIFMRFATFYRLGLGILMAGFLGFTLWIVLKPGNRNLHENSAPVRVRPAFQKEISGVKEPITKSVALQIRPLKIMEHFLEGMLAIPEGQHLYWGDMRLGQRDLRALRTPVLLHIIENETRKGWVCGRKFHESGLQVWNQGEWKTRGLTILGNWTGRCKVPFWIRGSLKNKRALRLGAEGPPVTNLQTWLSNLGVLRNVTGVFDEQTRVAVRQFQLQEGLKPDGVAGRQTLALLFQNGGELKKVDDSGGEKSDDY